MKNIFPEKKGDSITAQNQLGTKKCIAGEDKKKKDIQNKVELQI